MSYISASPLALLLAFFCFGYVGIALEHILRVNKAAIAIFTAVICWSIYFLFSSMPFPEEAMHLKEYISDVSQIVFFLLGAMTIVELVDSHGGFRIVTDYLSTRSKKKLLWVGGFMGFFLSAVLDNLTATIVMVSLLRKLIPNKEDRQVYGAMMVIATNAGGAWTPIGDVTTTMLWINGQISTLGIMKALFIPSLCCLLVPLIWESFKLKGSYPAPEKSAKGIAAPKAKLMFYLGIGALVFVPIFKVVTGLPPFMGMFVGLSILWVITDIFHQPHEDRKHLSVPHALTRVDISGVLFFLGILLAIKALEISQVLSGIATWLGNHVGNLDIIALIIGLISAIVDNIPLVAATMGMYPLSLYPTDDRLWELIAYAAGTGGSILIIGSAAGVALMGLERVHFVWYLKRISFVALLGYLAGFGAYLLVN